MRLKLNQPIKQFNKGAFDLIINRQRDKLSKKYEKDNKDKSDIKLLDLKSFMGALEKFNTIKVLDDQDCKELAKNSKGVIDELRKLDATLWGKYNHYAEPINELSVLLLNLREILQAAEEYKDNKFYLEHGGYRYKDKKLYFERPHPFYREASKHGKHVMLEFDDPDVYKKYVQYKQKIQTINKDLLKSFNKCSIFIAKKLTSEEINQDVINEKLYAISFSYLLDIALSISYSLIGTNIVVTDSELSAEHDDNKFIKSEEVLGKNLEYLEELIFPAGKPKKSDIEQGLIGDCALLASLISIVDKNPNAIKSCFVNIRPKSVDIRLFKVKQKTRLEIMENKGSYLEMKWEDIIATTECLPKQPVIITIDNSFLSMQMDGKEIIAGNRVPETGLWVNYLEKAYAIYTSRGYEGAENIKSRGNKALTEFLFGVNGSAAMAAITGTRAEHRAIMSEELVKLIDISFYSKISEYFSSNTAAPAPKGEYKENTLKIYNTIKKVLSKNKAVAVGFSKSFTAEDGRMIKERHAYSILEIEENPKSKLIYATIRDPHGMRSDVTTEEEVMNVLESSTKEQRSRTTYSVELNDLVSNCSSLYYQENNKPKKLI